METLPHAYWTALHRAMDKQAESASAPLRRKDQRSRRRRAMRIPYDLSRKELEEVVDRLNAALEHLRTNQV
jgi:hypothetical protein